MNRKHVAALVLVLVASLSVVAAATNDESPEAWETALDLEIIDSILTTHLKQHAGFEHPTTWIELDAYSKELPNMFRSRLALRDGFPTTPSALILGAPAIHYSELLFT